MFKKTRKSLWNKWIIAFKLIPILIVVIIVKIIFHKLGYEIIALNALFTSLVAGTIFLLGFLISGVLSDYKESEKIPSDLAATLEALHDSTTVIKNSKDSITAKKFQDYQKLFLTSLLDWFYKKEKTTILLNKINGMNDFFVDMEKEGVPANYIIKMQNEQSSIRKTILRIHTIKDTDFVASAYAIVEALGFAISMGMIMIKIEPFYEALFFTILVTFLVWYMFFLIKDLDNPFDYAEKGETGTEVPLKPLYDLEKKWK